MNWNEHLFALNRLLGGTKFEFNNGLKLWLPTTEMDYWWVACPGQDFKYVPHDLLNEYLAQYPDLELIK